MSQPSVPVKSIIFWNTTKQNQTQLFIHMTIVHFMSINSSSSLQITSSPTTFRRVRKKKNKIKKGEDIA